MRMTCSCLAWAKRGMLNSPESRDTVRARNLSWPSVSQTTAPVTGSPVVLSRKTPWKRCALAGTAQPKTAAIHAAVSQQRPLRAPTRQLAHPGDESVDFVLGRVAAAPNANEPIRNQSQTLDNGCRVEVAVRDEHAPLGQRHRNVVGLPPGEGERQRRRARRVGARAVQRQPVDLGESLPHL